MSYALKHSGNYTWIMKNGRHLSCVYTVGQEEADDAEKDAQDLIDLANAQRHAVVEGQP